MKPLVYNPPGPVAGAFMRSDAFVRGIRGPIGSGKSTACVMEIIRRAKQQKPGPDGKRRSRWAVVRNTFPELKTTTIKTWHQWVPQHIGRWVDSGPPRHHIQEADLDLEVLFLALDSPGDIAKLLSLELTGAWVNEAREVPKAVLDALTGRVGRFPPARDGGPSWSGIILDTNPPDTDHWWYRLAEEKRPAEFAFFAQPSGLSDRAENLPNLPDGYYRRACAGKDEAWVKIYVEGEYGFVMDGKPVYPEYRDSLHCTSFELQKHAPLLVGLDFGLTPAAVLGQRLPGGRLVWRREWVTEDMGVRRFGELLATDLRWYREAGFELGAITGDPAGEARDHDERTAFQILAAVGLEARPASTNEFSVRREAVAKPLSTIIDGAPGLLLHPDCLRLRKGMAGGYCYRRLQVSGQERFHDVPDKGPLSHVCEAGQYLNLGAGEGRAVVRRAQAAGGRRAVALSDYNILG